LKKRILDTSVCIDLHFGGLLEAIQELPYEFVLPDVILAELIKPPAETLRRLGFVSVSFAGDELRHIMTLRDCYPKPSTNDLFALYLARKNAWPLITGDKALRKAAESENVSVNGLLWLLDELVRHNVITKNTAAQALERILASGSWLPRAECEVRLRKWGKKEALFSQ
jgi:predicted nucleic acid-binding protein